LLWLESGAITQSAAEPLTADTTKACQSVPLLTT